MSQDQYKNIGTQIHNRADVSVGKTKRKQNLKQRTSNCCSHWQQRTLHNGKKGRILKSIRPGVTNLFETESYFLVQIHAKGFGARTSV